MVGIPCVTSSQRGQVREDKEKIGAHCNEPNVSRPRLPGWMPCRGCISAATAKSSSLERRWAGTPFLQDENSQGFHMQTAEKESKTCDLRRSTSRFTSFITGKS